MSYFKVGVFLFLFITLIAAQEESKESSMERRKPMRYGKRGDYPIDWKSIGNPILNERHQKLLLIPVRKSYLDQLREQNNLNYDSKDSTNDKFFEFNDF
jgi:hypothetical protein